MVDSAIHIPFVFALCFLALAHQLLLSMQGLWTSQVPQLIFIDSLTLNTPVGGVSDFIYPI